MSPRNAFLVCWLSLSAPVGATEFSRPVQQAPGNGQALLAVELDSQIYAVSAADFGDLRLLDGQAVETPFLLRPAAATKTVRSRRPSLGQITALQTAGDSLSFEVHLADNAEPADGLTLVTAQRDFEYELTVQGSNDGEHWRTLTERAAVYDYSRHLAIANLDVPLPTNRDRYFKILVGKAGQTRIAEVSALTRRMQGHEELERSETQTLYREPLHIERIEFWHLRSESRAEAETVVDYPLPDFQVHEDAERRATLIDIDSRKLPLTGLRLDVATPSFQRDVELQTPRTGAGDSAWQTLSSGQLRALRFGDIQQAETRIDFPEQRGERYRLVIHNQDNPPLQITALTGLGKRYRLLFIAAPNTAYRLTYGSQGLAKARYDTAAIDALLLRGVEPTPVGLGAAVATGQAAAENSLTSLINSREFLLGVIALMVPVLAWSLYRAGKRIGNLPR
ncbi:DUF3999 family protein [Methylomonas sp. UP202]|uniref:DUF3999 family protein n=1 Tax=Methylomonas sp. UP202 TaxID=3040943 RepID=UPI002479F239|nr:DUF3999 family protein [Methylomonas sp. UP202]WGS87078.1 DUF3999 family protein [Methylomonas sp. UP202]